MGIRYRCPTDGAFMKLLVTFTGRKFHCKRCNYTFQNYKPKVVIVPDVPRCPDCHLFLPKSLYCNRCNEQHIAPDLGIEDKPWSE